jgi:hypothetical protein
MCRRAPRGCFCVPGPGVAAGRCGVSFTAYDYLKVGLGVWGAYERAEGVLRGLALAHIRALWSTIRPLQFEPRTEARREALFNTLKQAAINLHNCKLNYATVRAQACGWVGGGGGGVAGPHTRPPVRARWRA